MQQCAHLIGDGGVHGRQMRLSLGPGVLDDVRSDGVADERVEPGRRRGGAGGGIRLRAALPSSRPRSSLGVGRRGRPAVSQSAWNTSRPGIQLVGVKVVDLLEAQVAGRHTEPRFETVHDVVEIVDVDLQRRPGGERRALGSGVSAEIANDQQTHRLIVFASTAGGAGAGAELELQTFWHDSSR